ncbi:5825_t:CDS:2 [Diversispora eburnea]|uniref:5825_t:CDS:1 n=1 Tax=Diversispora eburnea TaxID=1213867 RepID=A0A9N8ZGY6_9GLOM|nr:5825_t:CDS:2 [Diversispora eburnea]
MELNKGVQFNNALELQENSYLQSKTAKIDQYNFRDDVGIDYQIYWSKNNQRVVTVGTGSRYDWQETGICYHRQHIRRNTLSGFMKDLVRKTGMQN